VEKHKRNHQRKDLQIRSLMTQPPRCLYVESGEEYRWYSVVYRLIVSCMTSEPRLFDEFRRRKTM